MAIVSPSQNPNKSKNDIHAIDLDNPGIDILNKINYVHNNSVRAGLVRNPDEYIYSSAIDYSRTGKGLVSVIVV
jgi:hypothetical protein